MKIGIESYLGFGDCTFNLPLIEAISKKHKSSVEVAVKADCADAFINVPFISKVHHCNGLWQGYEWFKKSGYEVVHQITQNVKFFEFKEKGHHSLIDTPTKTGEELGVGTFDPRPQIYLTKEETDWADRWMSQFDKPVILEAVYKSGQSWCDEDAMRTIIDGQEKPILWACHTPAPEGTMPIPASRRCVIACLKHCRRFFSVGSGIFCASLALNQKPPITCLWRDELYKYEMHIPKSWADITWVHDHEELRRAI